MPGKKTLQYPKDSGVLPIHTIRVEVVGGAQGGLVADTEEETLHVGTAESNDLVLDDSHVSRFHLELSREGEGILVVDHGSTNGTFLNQVRVHRAVVPAGAQLVVGKTTLRLLDGEQRAIAVHDDDTLGPLRGTDAAMRRLFARIRKAASSDVPVLLVGESGTGKELIARALHDEGARKDQPFVVVDCASLTPTLVASELFGHEKGAFTGADRRHAGAFERANGGTIFLDEIGELPEQLQPTLLGVLERRRFRRLGGRDEIDVDVRVVSATNRDLRAEVNAGTFRLDLYYRIAVVRVMVPPLRERPMDIPLLVSHFLGEMGETAATEELIGPTMMASLQRHHWPGNVRELRNYVEATVAMGESPPLDDAPHGSSPSTMPPGPSVSLGELLDLSYKDARATLLTEFEKHYLPHALERAGGNVSQAARECGMDRSHLWDLLRRHGVR